MDPLEGFLYRLDPVLIAPYRWLADPAWAWWLGTLVLALWACLLGWLTTALLERINRRYLTRYTTAMDQENQAAMAALAAGDKAAYKAGNKRANDAFGRAFFLQMAMGSASLWPAFLAVAWLQPRFGQLQIPLPLTPWSVGYVPGFLVCYLVIRLVIYMLKKYLNVKGR